MHTFKYCMLIAFISVACSCNKLDEKVYSQNSPDNFFSSQTDVTAALVGMYRPLQACCGSYEQAGTFILNTVSDEGNAQSNWGQYDLLTYSPTSPAEIGDMWSTTYRSIASSNFVLDNETKITLLDKTPDHTYTKQVLAEAKFIRALNYFQLVQMFGGVPLRTTQAKRADEVDVPRNTEDEVYASIISDFTDAAANLPETNVAGKPTKWAATAFLAKVYLTRKDYPNALTQTDLAINSGVYALQTKFADIFDVDKKDNSEVIFDIQYIRTDGQGMRMEPLVLGPTDPFASGGSTGWGLSSMEDGFYNKYTPADDRISTTFSNPAPGQTTYYAGKWRDPKGVSADGHGNNFIVYRYADLLLIKAEVENEINGPNTAAYNAINQIRTRASLPDLSGLTQDSFRDAVLWERHLELAYEEWRWFDLKRTGRLKDALVTAGKTWDDRFYLFPIPQAEIDASNGLIKQNPGY